MFQEAVENWGDTCSMTIEWNPFALGLTDENGTFHQIKEAGHPYKIQKELTITTTGDDQTSLVSKSQNSSLRRTRRFPSDTSSSPASLLDLLELFSFMSTFNWTKINEPSRSSPEVSRTLPSSLKSWS